MKAGKQSSTFSLIRSLARSLPTSRNAGLDEHEQAGLLTSRSSYQLRLTAKKNAVAHEAFVTRYSGATVRDLHPASLFSPNRGLKHLPNLTTTNCVVTQRTAPLVDVKLKSVKLPAEAFTKKLRIHKMA
jgi:hypothetical protein